MMVPASQKHYY